MYTRNPYEIALDKNGANYVPLSPLSFIRRTAAVFPERTAVIHGAIRRSSRETFERCIRLAAALKERGIGVGDTVCVMAPEYTRAAGGTFRRAHGRRGAQCAQHPAGR